MKKAIVICKIDPNRLARAQRMIHLLHSNFDVSLLSTKNYEGEFDVNFYHVSNNTGNIFQKLYSVLLIKSGLFEKYVWSKERTDVAKVLSAKDFDLIVCHHIDLLPLALKIKNHGAVVFDARDYYPEHYEDRFIWKFFIQELNKYLCKKYLPQCDEVITVCDGLAEEYKKFCNIKPKVIQSLPFYHNLTPSTLSKEKIRIIHHGSANASRKIEQMIYMCDYLDERFEVNLMLLPTDKMYYNKLKLLCKKRQNITMLDTIPQEELVRFSNQYDIGLYLLSPNSFNLKYSLPNKFFEYIQSRLAVAIGPSVEMAKIVRQYDCGVVAENFNPESLAYELNNLSTEKIKYYKYQSHMAAKELNADQTAKKLEAIFEPLFSSA
jgi:glycosyltransferase involved in cell wall biosynthesis